MLSIIVKVYISSNKKFNAIEIRSSYLCTPTTECLSKSIWSSSQSSSSSNLTPTTSWKYYQNWIPQDLLQKMVKSIIILLHSIHFEYIITWLIISNRWPRPPECPPESISICARELWSFTETTSTVEPVSALRPSSNEVNTSETSDEAILSRLSTEWNSLFIVAPGSIFECFWGKSKAQLSFYRWQPIN